MNSSASRLILPFSYLIILLAIGLVAFLFLYENTDLLKDDPVEEIIATQTDKETAEEIAAIQEDLEEEEIETYTLNEVAKHTTADDCYVILNTNVYELSADFIAVEDDIFTEETCGLDLSLKLTPEFEEEILLSVEDFLIGEVKVNE